jgi:hypothetical protein
VVSDVPVDDEAESPDLPVLSPSEVLIGIGFAYVYS